jgi:thioredoxin reductase (NADPH)
MSSWPTPSALDAGTQTFPTLTASQINRARPWGTVRQVQPGDILFKPGDTNVPFFILLSGSMEIVQPGLQGERPITTHDPNAFTGELSMISGQRCLVLGRVTEAGEFIEISAESLRSLVARDAELSEVIMRALSCAGWRSSLTIWAM